MADFDAILRKALASRPGAPGEERRKIYERARQALIRQLTGFEPPLPPEDISRQRLALESSIRKVESEVAANGGVLPGTVVPTPAAAPPSPRPAPPVSRATPAAPPSAVPARPVMPPVTQPAQRAPAQPVTAPPVVAQPPVPAAPAPSLRQREPIPSLNTPAPTFGAPPPEPHFVDDPQSGDLPDFEPERSQPIADAPKKKSNVGLIIAMVALLLAAGGGFAAYQGGYLDQYLNTGDGTQVAVEEPLEDAPEVRTVGSDPTQSSERLLPDNQGAVEETPTQPTAPETAEPDTTPAAGSGLPVAQTAILYEEGLTPEADGFTAPGRTVWRLDESGSLPVIVGTVEVPARGITMNIRISRNLDDALPATHLIEFSFQFSDAFPAEGVSELVGVVVKPEEQSGGDPLRGAIVDLGDGVFWQALAAGEADRAVNVPLLRDGAWFDLPLLYSDNRRAIITFEKGQDGINVFNQALNAWSAQ